MNRRNLAALAVIVALLVAALIALEFSQDSGTAGTGDLLLPDFAAHANDVTRVIIERSGDDTATLVVEKSGDQWRVPSRDNYPASIATVREVLRAMAEAKIVEAKTANADLHDRIGLRDPSVDGSKGVKVTASGDGFSAAVVFGNTAQGSYRYARLADASQTFLIDRNPSLPSGIGEWLARSLLDIDATAIRSVRIEHPDGEVVPIEKVHIEAADFDVADIPAGRQLSYSTVANGIAGALNDLQLDEVRKAPPESADPVVTTFETFDGQRFVVRSYVDGDANWIAIDVEATGEGTPDEELRERLAGWQFSIAEFKANLLKRRFADILKPLPESE